MLSLPILVAIVNRFCNTPAHAQLHYECVMNYLCPLEDKLINSLIVSVYPFLCFRSQTHSLEALRKQCRVFCVRGQARSEAHLLEITPENENEPLSACLRSRGCFVFYHCLAQNIYLWHGSKATLSLKKCAHSAAKLLRNR